MDFRTKRLQNRLQKLLLASLLVPFFGVPLSHAGIIDGDDRMTPDQFFAVAAHPTQSSFTASGTLYCGLAGVRDATAQVVLQNDLLLTAAHPFFDSSTQHLRPYLNKCTFTPLFGPGAGIAIRLRIETLRIYGDTGASDAVTFQYSKMWKKDLAVVRLDLSKHPELNLNPYGLAAEVSRNSTATAMTLISGHDDGPAGQADFNPALQTCNVRDFEPSDNSTDARAIMFTNCDVQNAGPSGAALLQSNVGTAAGSINVVGILTGHLHKTTGPYVRNSNSSIFIGIDAEAKKWILDYSSLADSPLTN